MVWELARDGTGMGQEWAGDATGMGQDDMDGFHADGVPNQIKIITLHINTTGITIVQTCSGQIVSKSYFKCKYKGTHHMQILITVHIHDGQFLADFLFRLFF